MIELDIKDRRILFELENNSRQPLANIAKKVKISKQSLNYKINRLRSHNVINHYVTILDTRKLGYTFYLTFIQLNNCSPEIENKIIDYIYNLSEVNWLVGCLGKWDLIAGFLVKDPVEVQRAYEKIMDKFGKYFLEKDLLIVVDAHPCIKKYLYGGIKLNKSNKDFYFGDRNMPKLTKVDFLILKELQKNSNLNNLQISFKIGVGYDTVKRHIEKMISSGLIQGFSIKLNPSSYSYEWHNVLLRTRIMDVKTKKKFISFVKSLKNVVFIIGAIGEWDSMLDLHVKNQLEVRETIEKIKIEFPNLIKNYETVMINSEKKVNFIPNSIFEKGGTK